MSEELVNEINTFFAKMQEEVKDKKFRHALDKLNNLLFAWGQHNGVSIQRVNWNS